MKKAVSLLLAAVLMLSLVGCGAGAKPSAFTAFAGETEIPTAFGYNEWDGAVYDREDLCVWLINEKADIPYIELGETVTLFLDGRRPDRCVMQDFIADYQGYNKYTEKEINTSEIKFRGGKYEFELPKHQAAYLSSDGESYERGGIMRGFKLTCTFGENECEYAFLLRTDAMQ